MAVVVNDFEVISSEPASPRRGGGGEAEGAATKAPPVDPRELARVLRALELRALRTWAH
jgi:hypothetical protein